MATTGRSTSVTGLVGLAFKPTDRFIGTRSNLGAAKEKRIRVDVKPEYRQLLLVNPLYLNKVRFSSLRSREQRVMQSWSNTNG